MEIQVAYRIAELAELTGWHEKRVLRTLVNSKVPVKKVGAVKLVFLSDIKEYLPEFWESLLLKRALQGDDE